MWIMSPNFMEISIVLSYNIVHNLYIPIVMNFVFLENMKFVDLFLQF